MPRHLTFLVAVLLGAGAVHAGPVPELDLEPVGSFTNPMVVTHAPGDGSRIFVAERAGRIRIVADGTILPEPFLDIATLVSQDFEGGFLGLAFHPEYDTNRQFFVHYTREGLVSVVARYQASSADPNVASPTSARILLSLDQPADNHNGGWIGFGPNDGYLYIAFGDGGFAGSGPERAQDITGQLLGKMLRIDVNGDDFPDTARNYAIPPGNPFVGVSGDDEIWAYGLRNPFRCGFDRVTGDLYIADVGGGSLEEIDFQPAASSGGENYGWGCMEGTQCNGSACICNGPGLTLPIHEYTHSFGCAITGGTVYRGCAIPELAGTYFYGDYCSGRIWSLRYDGSEVSDLTERTDQLSTGGIVNFGEDADGEIYFVSLSGSVSRLVTATPPPDADMNGVPDTCEGKPCPGDVNGDGVVNVQDLTAVILAWGTGDENADVNGDGTVNVQDLAQVTLAWGECP